jgi:hypothetical protein
MMGQIPDAATGQVRGPVQGRITGQVPALDPDLTATKIPDPGTGEIQGPGGCWWPTTRPRADRSRRCRDLLEGDLRLAVTTLEIGNGELAATRTS